MFKAILTTIALVAATSASAWTHDDTPIYDFDTYQTDDGSVFVPLQEGHAPIVQIAVDGNTDLNDLLTSLADMNDSNALYGLTISNGQINSAHINPTDWVVSAIDGQWVAANNQYIPADFVALVNEVAHINSVTAYLEANEDATFTTSEGFDITLGDHISTCEKRSSDLLGMIEDHISIGSRWVNWECVYGVEAYEARHIDTDWENFWNAIGDICLGAGSSCGDTVRDAIERLDNKPPDFPLTPAGIFVLVANEAFAEANVNVKFAGDPLIESVIAAAYND